MKKKLIIIFCSIILILVIVIGILFLKDKADNKTKISSVDSLNIQNNEKSIIQEINEGIIGNNIQDVETVTENKINTSSNNVKNKVQSNTFNTKTQNVTNKNEIKTNSNTKNETKNNIITNTNTASNTNKETSKNNTQAINNTNSNSNTNSNPSKDNNFSTNNTVKEGNSDLANTHFTRYNASKTLYAVNYINNKMKEDEYYEMLGGKAIAVTQKPCTSWFSYSADYKLNWAALAGLLVKVYIEDEYRYNSKGTSYYLFDTKAYITQTLS